MLDLISPAEAARMLGVSKQAIAYRIKRGTIPVAARVSGRPALDRAVIQRMVRAEAPQRRA